jgi:hypothetical protein
MREQWTELIVSSLDDGGISETPHTDFIFAGLIARTGILQYTCDVMN